MSLQGTLRALADPTRREILNLLKGDSMSAGDISENFRISFAAVSRHLSVLKNADLIRDKRNGKFIYYELNTSVLEEIMLWISELKGGECSGEKGVAANTANLGGDAASVCGGSDTMAKTS